MPTLNTARGPLYVADYRRPNTGSAPMLMLHGAGGSHLDIPPMLRRAATLQPLAPDLNGHGRSPGNGHTRLEDHAADMLAVLDALELPTAFVLGHSMGGAVALMMALAVPQRVAGLVLIGSGSRLPVSPRIIQAFQENPTAAIAMITAWMWPKDTPDARLAQTREHMAAVRPQVIINDFLACDACDVSQQIGDLMTRCLILHGTLDRMMPIAGARDMARAMPRAALQEFPDGGHMIHFEQEEAVCAAVTAWRSADAV
jgi:pimeloyl-ACP methyl ester carboxylesterase